MDSSVVRLTDIELTNFKNVEKGVISLNSKGPYNASILGVYGQNGSGKSALIDAISLLRYLIIGAKVPSYFADYITIDCSTSHLKFFFSVEFDDGQYDMSYEFDFMQLYNDKVFDASKNNWEEEKRVSVYNERLKIALPGEKKRMMDVINTDSNKVFAPESKFRDICGDSDNTFTDYLVLKKLASQEGRSFIFSADFIKKLENNVEEKKEDVKKYIRLIERIVFYGRMELFILNSVSSGYVNLNYLPMMFKYDFPEQGIAASILLDMDHPTPVLKERLNIISKVIEGMNIVLEKIIPGMTIEVRDYGDETLKDGRLATRIELMSKRNSKIIPLKYESDGIKKIISILDLLIIAYNTQSITVAIDELDSGVFEYLLGEILKIISEQGRGQLIFTSHNLRPLETIDKRFIVFTTTNPLNRYVRMKHVMANNNLRDFYYRDISVGTQDEELYDYTDNAKIAMAFRKAGEIL